MMSRSSSAKAAIMVKKNLPSPCGEWLPDSLPVRIFTAREEHRDE
jgi:hypothetical protein